MKIIIDVNASIYNYILKMNKISFLSGFCGQVEINIVAQYSYCFKVKANIW